MCCMAFELHFRGVWGRTGGTPLLLANCQPCRPAVGGALGGPSSTPAVALCSHNPVPPQGKDEEKEVREAFQAVGFRKHTHSCHRITSSSEALAEPLVVPAKRERGRSSCLFFSPSICLPFLGATATATGKPPPFWELGALPTWAAKLQSGGRLGAGLQA